jgi:hypothetical protein
LGHDKLTRVNIERVALAATCAVLLASAARAADKASLKSEEGLAAWPRIHSALTSPRCLNCHTATNSPQQGDDRHRHLFNVVRGPGNDGVSGLRCATCHQSANADSTGVPGAQGWRLAPLSMAWQAKDGKVLPSGAICRQLAAEFKDHGPELIRHHEQEPLVLWAFAPGKRHDGTARARPPLTHKELLTATRAWVAAGMPCP